MLAIQKTAPKMAGDNHRTRVRCGLLSGRGLLGLFFCTKQHQKGQIQSSFLRFGP